MPGKTATIRERRVDIYAPTLEAKACWNMGGIWADGAQLYRYQPSWKDIVGHGPAGVFPVRANGFMFVETNAHPVLGIEVKIEGQWYRIPRPLELLFG